MTRPLTTFDPGLPDRALCAYLLGTLDFDTFHSLQRRLIYDVGGDRTTASLLLCDHPPGVTIGREGSRTHIRPSFEFLDALLQPARRTSQPINDSAIHWVSRGGGVMLHLPGQVACYPILPLDVLNLAPADYVNELLETGIELLGKFNIQGVIDPDRPGIRANGRRIIHLGAAIRDRITSFGLVVNVNPDLDLFHKIHCDGDDVPMTSIQRESNCRLRISGIRQQLVELISNRFGFDRVSIFHNHPSLWPRSTRYVAAQRP